MKNWLKVFILIIYFLGVAYLVLPEPVLLADLPNSFKSTEPGDTVEIPGVWAYYTHLSRKEIVDFYQSLFARSSLEIPLPSYLLSHPPEYVKENFRDVQRCNFYEELVHPLRESLFICGWIPKEDEVYLKESENPRLDFIVEEDVFPAKVTLYYLPSPLWARLLIWTGIIFGGFVLIKNLRLIILSPWKKRK